jgi:sugar-phosphatase
VAEGELRPGVHRAIGMCQRHGLALALASSSQYRLIERVLEHFDLRRYFPIVHSAEDEAYGKPHPAVFLSAAAKLGVAPGACLVWEDAAAGVLAAKAARMTCVAVPEPSERARRSFAIADVILGSLEEIDDVVWAVLEAAQGGLEPGVVP